MTVIWLDVTTNQSISKNPDSLVVKKWFHAFKLLELSTNSSILAGKPAYTIIGTYKNPSFGLQQLMETGTIIGDKIYSVQYIADAPRYADYLPTVQWMIQSLVIK